MTAARSEPEDMTPVSNNPALQCGDLVDATPSTNAPLASLAVSGGGMPRISDIISTWVTPRETGANSGDGSLCGQSGGVATANEIVRARKAPAGPHPYLDRFASGMHRPLEDHSRWRQASIQPVPIPDLSHTGIQTKFSIGAGNGFTPDGVMTGSFRCGIQETIRNLPRDCLDDARDMKTRDYARAVQSYRADRGGGSLVQTHISSLELSGLSPCATPGSCGGWGGVGAGVGRGSSGVPWQGGPLRQTKSTETSRNRTSPPVSPTSAGQAIGKIGVGDRDCRTPAEERKAILRREWSIVKQAAAAAAAANCPITTADINQNAEPPRAPTQPATRYKRATASSARGDGKKKFGSGEDGVAWRNCREQRSGGGVMLIKTAPEYAMRTSATCDNAVRGAKRNGWEGAGRGGEKSESGSLGKGVLNTQERLPMGGGECRLRGRERRERYPESNAGARWEQREDCVRSGRNDTPSTPLLLATSPTTARARTRSRTRARTTATTATKETSRPSQRRLKKPFSADSLFACLLDVNYGNTRDLSPTKFPGQGWDLNTLPSGITAGIRYSSRRSNLNNNNNDDDNRALYSGEQMFWSGEEDFQRGRPEESDFTVLNDVGGCPSNGRLGEHEHSNDRWGSTANRGNSPNRSNSGTRENSAERGDSAELFAVGGENAGGRAVPYADQRENSANHDISASRGKSAGRKQLPDRGNSAEDAEDPANRRNFADRERSSGDGSVNLGSRHVGQVGHQPHTDPVMGIW